MYCVPLLGAVGDMKSSYSSSYNGPEGQQSTIATYNNGAYDQITNTNGQVSRVTGNIPGVFHPLCLLADTLPCRE